MKRSIGKTTKSDNMESNYSFKSLENLEKDYWGEPEYESYLVTTCHNLRKKPINNFSVEDLRIMIGQNIGIKYLIPVAMEILKENVFAEGDFYEGDLLKYVLDSNLNYWKENKTAYEKMMEILNQNDEKLKSLQNKSVMHSIENFKNIKL